MTFPLYFAHTTTSTIIFVTTITANHYDLHHAHGSQPLIPLQPLPPPQPPPNRPTTNPPTTTIHHKQIKLHHCRTNTTTAPNTTDNNNPHHYLCRRLPCHSRPLTSAGQAASVPSCRSHLNPSCVWPHLLSPSCSPLFPSASLFIADAPLLIISSFYPLPHPTPSRTRR